MRYLFSVRPPPALWAKQAEAPDIVRTFGFAESQGNAERRLWGRAVPFWKNERVTPAQIIILGFFLMILTGAALLMLPWSTSEWGGAAPLDALFTAASATCVTGLVVHDTALYWTPFGQGVILALIQVGGMGVVTVAVAVSMLAGKKIGLKQRWIMQESISAPQVGGIVRQTRFILKTALLIETVGAMLLALRLCPRFGLGKGLWYAVFHSVSAVCNAGFVTWHDVRQHGVHLRRYRLQSKLILSTTLALLLGAFLFFWLYEFRQPQWRGLSAGERGLAAMFQAVTPRTAGFNTVDLKDLSQPGQLFTIALMLAGGSPGSTAGGFKTTTLAVMLLGVGAIFRRRDSACCFGRRVPDEALRSASAIFLLYILLFLTGGMLISGLDGVPILSALFESASAIGTVGLSLGITAELSAASRLILIFLMYFGRVGGLTMIYAVASGAAPGIAQLPRERVTVG